MKYTDAPVRWRTLVFAPVLLALVASTVLIRPASLAAGKKKVDTPTLSFVVSSPTSIDVTICAPTTSSNPPGSPTGLPAGFSVQWMTQDDFDNFGGWPNDESSAPDSFCKASFSGNAFNSRYDLAAGECVTVKIGDLLFDNGASSNCPVALECNTKYVFRAFGHANSSLNRSDWSLDGSGTTLPCNEPDTGGCTYTQGYWKTHGPIPTGNNTNVWPVASISMGSPATGYSQLQAQSIFDTPSGGNGLISLAHQLMAARLNIANGASPTAIAGTLTAADTLIGNRVVPPVGAGSLTPGSVSALVGALTNYNEGATGPGHCPQ